MHNVSAPLADQVVADLGPLRFRHLLDVGGASGTWTIAFLRAGPQATATLFDLPEVIPLARERIAGARLTDRVTLRGGDFDVDPLPAGADFVWLSAIVHQNSRAQNRHLFAKAHDAMTAGGTLAIRDIVMDDSRTEPVEGAIFAVHMLVATEGGGTFTFDELSEDLAAAGFASVTMTRRGRYMDSVVRAVKPPA
jgi:hypothetical protein